MSEETNATAITATRRGLSLDTLAVVVALGLAVLIRLNVIRVIPW